MIVAAVGTESTELDWLRIGWTEGLQGASEWELTASPNDDFLDSELPMQLLLREIAYICVKFRPLTEEIWAKDKAPFTDHSDARTFLAGTQRVTLSSTPNKPNMEATEEVLDSIEKLIDSLPMWAKKLIHVLKESLKILRLQLD